MELVKIGGSIITEKNRVLSFRKHAAAYLANEIRLSGKVPLVVHGTGTAGKAFARHYRADHRTDDWMVYQQTGQAITRLQQQLVQAFCDAGVACCPLPANALFHQRTGTVEWYGLDQVTHLLECGVVPLLCGDVLVEGPGRFQIISSDAIAVAAATRLPVTNSVFVTDVDGVLDDEGRLIPRIDEAATVTAHDSDQRDVTGGMTAKIAAALEIAALDIRVAIVNGHVPGRLRAALERRPVVGTRVTAGRVAAWRPG